MTTPPTERPGRWEPWVAGVLLAACQAAPGGADPADPVWLYLRDKYDADGDGRVASGEYDRGERPFARLDRDGDGALTESDFAPSGAGDAALDATAELRAWRALASTFQVDEDASRLSMIELEDACSIYDADCSGTIEAREFAAAAAGRRRPVPGDDAAVVREALAGNEPWRSLLAAADGDADGALGKAEVFLFFWARTGRRPLVRFDEGGTHAFLEEEDLGASTKPTGPTVGTLAPDFTLSSPDGASRTTLSDFRGQRPVALIFGSYT